MNDQQNFLANAYLDDELTVDERRIAESDPEVMAEVEQLRALRDRLRDVAPPDAQARETAVAAAMAEFTPTATAAPAAPPVVPIRPRPASRRFLAVAAAVVAVAGLGIVVSQADFGDDNDDDTASVADEALSDTAARPDDVTEATAESTTEATDSQTMVESAPAADAADAGADVAGDDLSDATANAEATMDEGVAAGAEEAAEAEADVGIAERVLVPPDFDPEAPILNEVALAIYGSYLLDQIDSSLLGPTPETTCAGDYQILDTAVYVLDGDERRVYIAVNEIIGSVSALDVDTCTELANGPLF